MLQSQHHTFNENFKRPSDYRRASIQLQREDMFRDERKTTKATATTTDRKLKISLTSDDHIMSKGDFGDIDADKKLITVTPTKDSLLNDIKSLVDTCVW